MSLFSELGHIRDMISPIAREMGVPFCRSLVMVYRNPMADQYIQVQPNPITNQLTSKMAAVVSQISEVELDTNDFEIKGISRENHSYQQIRNADYFIVDGEVSSEGILTPGIICDFVSISEQALGWDLVLKRRRTLENG